MSKDELRARIWSRLTERGGAAFPDYIVTPEDTIRCPHRHPRPKGILWPALPPDKIAEIPLLAKLRGQALTS